jgi:hypothetical protein
VVGLRDIMVRFSFECFSSKVSFSVDGEATKRVAGFYMVLGIFFFFFSSLNEFIFKG